MTLKEKLLEIGLCIDNEYLDKYVELIKSNRETKREKFKTQKHHIVPKYYYKINKLELDNSKENIVNLSHTDHILAHLYLFKCSSTLDYVNANLYSLSFVIRGLKFNSRDNEIISISEIENLIEIVDDSYQKLKELMYKDMSVKNKNLKNTLGKIWIKNEEKNEHKLISKSDLDFYISDGWVRGKLPYSEESKKLISKKLKMYYSSDKNREVFKKRAKNRVWVFKDDELKAITNIEVENYLNNGWSLGRLKFSEEARTNLSNAHKGLPSNVKGRKKINNGMEMKTVKIEELKMYLDSGWKLGELPKSKEWLKKIAKANTKKNKC